MSCSKVSSRQKSSIFLFFSHIDAKKKNVPEVKKERIADYDKPHARLQNTTVQRNAIDRPPHCMSRSILTQIPHQLLLQSKPTSRIFLLSNHLRQARTMASSSTQPTIPKTMKGVLIETTGGTEVLQYRTDLPVPEPKEGQVLVRNEFIGINYIDT